MLQRIQTVFLALVVLLMIAMIFLPIWIYQAPDGTAYNLTALHLETAPEGAEPMKDYMPYVFVAVLAALAALVAAFEITRFTNRLLQMKLGALNSLIMAGAMGLAFYFASDMNNSLNVVGNYGIALFMPAVAMVCNAIANRFIRKDDKLVRSVDRIR